MYEALQQSTAKKFVINSSRRLGKSYMLALIALEQALQKPGSQIKFAAPNQKMAKKIIHPLLKQIMENCPKALKPRFRVHEGMYEFPNGSEIHVAGTEMGQIDNLRGQACDLALIDEAGFVSDLEYVVESVLMPQTLTRPNARMILASTPPISPDHDFVQVYMKQAMEEGSYARFTIYDNPLLSEEQIETYKKNSGGEDSTTWRREYLAEIVTETDNAILPEATNDEMWDEILGEPEKPPFFNPITVIDLGYVDYTGILFGYYDFRRAKIVIQDEILVNRSTSADIIKLVREKERELWGDIKITNRVVDGNAMQIADMNETHKFTCRTPQKSDLEANVNRVRMDLNERRFVISPKCVSLQSQMKYAIWDSNRSKFSRSANGGHWDLVAALMYLCKHIDRTTNPYPPDYGYSYYNDFGFSRQRRADLQNKFAPMFPVRTRIKKRF